MTAWPACGPPHVRLSVVTPAYNESENLGVLYERLSATFAGLALDWEWIVVDDHSTDGTFAMVVDLASRDPRVRCFRFARNFGSHTAIACGLHEATGDAAVVLAGDLQDPPETVPALLAEWQAGAQVVWAVRARREGEKIRNLGFARLYYILMRHLIGVKQLPPTGSDFFLIDRHVLDAFRQFPERHVSLFALIAWMGFRQASVPYTKQARLRGQSGWSLEKKVKLVFDSITSFSDMPVRIMSWLGIACGLTAVCSAVALLAARLAGRPIEGWAWVLVALAAVSGVQMLMLGALGEYVWRALDEARRRPRYLIEAIAGVVDTSRSDDDARPPRPTPLSRLAHPRRPS